MSHLITKPTLPGCLPCARHRAARLGRGSPSGGTNPRDRGSSEATPSGERMLPTCLFGVFFEGKKALLPSRDSSITSTFPVQLLSGNKSSNGQICRYPGKHSTTLHAEVANCFLELGSSPYFFFIPNGVLRHREVNNKTKTKQQSHSKPRDEWNQRLGKGQRSPAGLSHASTAASPGKGRHREHDRASGAEGRTGRDGTEKRA